MQKKREKFQVEFSVSQYAAIRNVTRMGVDYFIRNPKRLKEFHASCRKVGNVWIITDRNIMKELAEKKRQEEEIAQINKQSESTEKS